MIHFDSVINHWFQITEPLHKNHITVSGGGQYSLFVCSLHPNMSSSRSGLSRPSGEDSRPIARGTFNGEAWVEEFTYYLNTMKERNPDLKHPSWEWVRLGFSQILLDSNQLAVISLPQDVNVKSAVADVVSSPISDLRKQLDEHTKHHSVNKVNSRQITLNQQ